MDVQRAILLFALAFVLIVLYQRWLDFQAPQGPEATQTAGQQTEGAPAEDIPQAPEPGVSDTPQAPDAADGEPAAPQVPQAQESGEGQERLVEVTTDLLRVRIDTNGGRIVETALLKHPVSVEQPDQPFLLLKQESTAKGDDIFTTQSGLIGRDREYPNHRTAYEVDQTDYRLREGADSLEVDLHWTAPDGVRYTKRFTFLRDNYDVKVDYLVENTSSTPWTGFIYGQFLRTYIPPDRGFILGAVPTFTGAAFYSPEDRFQKIDFDDIEDQPVKRQVAGGWVAMVQHYFVGGWFPRDNGDYSFYTRAIDHPG
ncbi:MAG TPA: membrane protein insertase YidC, partial [Arenicellales bacterium]|nr:membrane protein insertase YidC [Arenicellales bacterium]